MPRSYLLPQKQKHFRKPPPLTSDSALLSRFYYCLRLGPFPPIPPPRARTTDELDLFPPSIASSHHSVLVEAGGIALGPHSLQGAPTVVIVAVCSGHGAFLSRCALGGNPHLSRSGLAGLAVSTTASFATSLWRHRSVWVVVLKACPQLWRVVLLIQGHRGGAGPEGGSGGGRKRPSGRLRGGRPIISLRLVVRLPLAQLRGGWSLGAEDTLDGIWWLDSPGAPVSVMLSLIVELFEGVGEVSLIVGLSIPVCCSLTCWLAAVWILTVEACEPSLTITVLLHTLSPPYTNWDGITKVDASETPAPTASCCAL